MPEAFDAVVAALRARFEAGTTRPLAFRLARLRALRSLVDENEAEIHAALADDLGKPEFEAFGSETGHVRSEVDHALAHIEEWMEPAPVGTPLTFFPSQSVIHQEPKGVVLIIAPWNYPFELVLSPLVGAIAAGNCAILKPSELAERTSALLASLVPRYLPTDVVRVVTGGPDASSALLAERFDHVFFTGSPAVGRIVAEAAARHLMSTTLELGGKSPAFVDDTAKLGVTARRLAWGKCYNAGQTCIAPDYVLVPEARKDELVSRLGDAIQDFYGEDPATSPDFARIINLRHFDRLVGYLGDGRAVIGGEHDRAERYVAPTVLDEVGPDTPALSEEIFGPILPLVPYRALDEAISFTRRHRDPLALYVFSRRQDVIDRLLDAVPAGGAVVNDALTQFSNPELPFGGRGQSGSGSYHGRFGFEAFSHRKPVVSASRWFDPSIRYPPYGAKLRWLRKLLG